MYSKLKYSTWWYCSIYECTVKIWSGLNLISLRFNNIVFTERASMNVIQTRISLWGRYRNLPFVLTNTQNDLFSKVAFIASCHQEQKWVDTLNRTVVNQLSRQFPLSQGEHGDVAGCGASLSSRRAASRPRGFHTYETPRRPRGQVAALQQSDLSDLAIEKSIKESN